MFQGKLEIRERAKKPFEKKRGAVRLSNTGIEIFYKKRKLILVFQKIYGSGQHFPYKFIYENGLHFVISQLQKNER
ncbi:MAG: hypothetical protein D6730_22050 [Bacteroidetes bacterium]|nr:MAG: hypothetical protein D6730_22050 [Bacteroidota bacterium]